MLWRTSKLNILKYNLVHFVLANMRFVVHMEIHVFIKVRNLIYILPNRKWIDSKTLITYTFVHFPGSVDRSAQRPVWSSSHEGDSREGTSQPPVTAACSPTATTRENRDRHRLRNHNEKTGKFSALLSWSNVTCLKMIDLKSRCDFFSCHL